MALRQFPFPFGKLLKPRLRKAAIQRRSCGWVGLFLCFWRCTLSKTNILLLGCCWEKSIYITSWGEGSLSHYSGRVLYILGVCLGFLPSVGLEDEFPFVTRPAGEGRMESLVGNAGFFRHHDSRFLLKMFHSCHLGGCVYPGFSYQKCSNPVGDCYWVRGISNSYWFWEFWNENGWFRWFSFSRRKILRFQPLIFRGVDPVMTGQPTVPIT